ncbi:hypothetical protein QF046_003111 [Microbacterium sp. W4I4]|uniref:PA2928 family protein n=1 Tax=Microbacterium sp. W4I4 TaxID=3042295 RepID=UPI00278391A2|nr:PA2928 family protein [Microbacterium sp. W4I4]MDQ0615470.1 hypothetical protein [Microbacterium sp. W4I4]
MRETEKKSRAWVEPLIGWSILVIFLVGGFLTLIETTAGPIRARVSGVVAVGEVEGRDIAVVVYETDTFPHLDLFRVESMGHSVQAEAFDLDTGERIWDTMLSNAYPSPNAEALAVGSEYAYVRSDDGLTVLDAASGEIVAEDAEIRGLDDDYIASLDAYAWDAEAKEIVLLDQHGTVLSIPLDSLDAAPASSAVNARWRDVLNTEEHTSGDVYYPDSWELLSYSAPLPDDKTVYADWASEGWDSDVLLDAASGYAAGSQYGFAVSQTYEPESSDASYVFQMGELASGRLIGTVEADDAAVSVVDDGRGHVVILTDDDSDRGLLVVATADGIRSSVIGERGFLGW